MTLHTLDYARALVGGGLSIIPVRAGGSKAPAVPAWREYEERLPSDAELTAWFGGTNEGLALICGRVSGSLEVLDFDDPTALKPWAAAVEDELGAAWLRQLPVSRTPSGGTHIFYRCSEIEGNQKLAQKPGAEGKPTVMIETRGQGGYVVIPPTPARYHAANRPYRLLRGDLCRIPTISPAERGGLILAARRLNRYVPAPISSRYESARGVCLGTGYQGSRPGDAFNWRSSWFDVLEPQGWKCLAVRDGVFFWQRPGKDGPGCSATSSLHHGDCLYVFSTNAYPFEPEHSYTKFGAFALLKWGGDFSRAAEVLAWGARLQGSAGL